MLFRSAEEMSHKRLMGEVAKRLSPAGDPAAAPMSKIAGSGDRREPERFCSSTDYVEYFPKCNLLKVYLRTPFPFPQHHFLEAKFTLSMMVNVCSLQLVSSSDPYSPCRSSGTTGEASWRTNTSQLILLPLDSAASRLRSRRAVGSNCLFPL